LLCASTKLASRNFFVTLTPNLPARDGYSLRKSLQNVHEPDFCAQKSLVKEVIESAGHLCLFLPKFHCELDFIEYFWGMVKKYLRDNCDYTFNTLQRLWPLSPFILFADGNTECTSGWRLTDWALGPMMLSYRSGNSVQQSISPTDAFQTLLQVLSTEALQPLWLCAKLGLLEFFFSLSFYAKKKPSWGSIHNTKSCIYARGNKFRIFFDGAKSLHKRGGL